MAYKPTPAGPKSLRAMFHWIWKELKSIEANIGSGGGPGVTDHSELTGVTANQHHDEIHSLTGPHSDVTGTPESGDILVFDGTNWAPQEMPSGGGDSEDKVHAGYGGVKQETAKSFPDMGALWDTLAFDASTVATPKDVVPDTLNNGLILSRSGIWRISCFINVSHNESNGGRIMKMRFYNDTGALAGQEFSVAVGRNQPGTTISMTFLADLGPTNAGNRFQLQLSGGTDSFTSVVILNTYFEANFVGELVV